ncbi:MAG: UbiA family prenyltransferase [Planctomycetota bacterium]|nr:UbiA family prenyltransferase [Planctomycetota bacterium]
MSRARELFRLARPSLAPTAAADVIAAAAIFAAAPSIWRVAVAAVGSACLYAGGMIQNDLVDLKRDRTLHPDRPLVRDETLVTAARWLAIGLFALGLVLCGTAGALLPAIGVALLATLYNLVTKIRFPHDAITLGAARACNLAVGLTVVGVARDGAVTYLAAYFLFIGGITIASRAEDQEPAQTRRLTLLLSFLPQFLGLGAFASLFMGERSVYLLLPLGALLVGLFQAMVAGTRNSVIVYVRRSLLLIFLVHAVCVWAGEKTAWLPPIVLLAALSIYLMTVAGRAQAGESDMQGF